MTLRDRIKSNLRHMNEAQDIGYYDDDPEALEALRVETQAMAVAEHLQDAVVQSVRLTIAEHMRNAVYDYVRPEVVEANAQHRYSLGLRIEEVNRSLNAKFGWLLFILLGVVLGLGLNLLLS